MRFLFLAFTTLLCTCGRAQLQSPATTEWLTVLATLPDTFQNLSNGMNVKLDDVLRLDFRPRENEENDYLESHLTLHSRHENLELRFHLRPLKANDLLANMVRLRSHTVAMNLASNDEDAVTSVHSFGEEELMAMNADWARMYTFRPKRSYSSRQHAQLVAVYRSDRGLAFAVLLFDKAPPTLEDRQLVLQFW